MLADDTLAGAAGSAIILGAALGTSVLAAIMSRRGQRVGLAAGYWVGLLGGLLAAWSVVQGEFLLLLAGMLLVGFTNGATQLSRYASAEMAEPARRASAIGLVVWAATVGAVAGPVIVPASATLSTSLGIPELVGPFVAPALVAGAAGLLLTLRLRPDPDELAVDLGADSGGTTVAAPMREIMRRPAVVVALVAMIVGQVVMVTIMSMTPLHMYDHGHELGAVGVVISAHVAGMFALSPISGRIVERIGSLPTILLGAAVLALAASMAAVAPPEGGAILFVALFVLGYGWNLGFVAGSALLTSALARPERARAQGFTDSLVWGSSAVASLAAGFVLAAVGFAALGLIGLALLALPVWTALSLRKELPAASAPAS